MPSAAARTKWRGVLVVAGGVLIHLSLGTLYTFGNLNPYLTSYMRWHGSAPNLKSTDASWVFALSTVGQSLTMAVGGLIQPKLGPKLTCLLGGWIMSAGVFVTFFSIKHSFILTAFTYGVVFGAGTGIAYATPLSCSMRWFPAKKGFVSGLVVAGFGGGAFIFNQIQTAFINPKNLAANQKVGSASYFDQPEVLEQVPKLFLMLSACYAVMQLIGSLLMCDPPAQQAIPEDEVSLVEEEATNIQDPPKGEADSSTALLENGPATNRGSFPPEEENISLRPREVLRSKYFYMLWLTLFLNGQCILFVSTLYKAYGQTFINDDNFLAVVGSFAAVFNASGRVWWGFLADKTSYRLSMMVSCACFTCVMLTFQATEMLGKEAFFLYVCLLFGSFSGSFVLIPTSVAKCFGREYMSINYGLVFTAKLVTAPVGALLAQQLLASIGWSGLFFLVSSFSFLAMLLTIMFTAKDRHGKEI